MARPRRAYLRQGRRGIHAEAVRRLWLQNISGPIRREFKALDQDRFAAAWLQHEPRFGLVVEYVGAEPRWAAMTASLGRSTTS